VRWALKTLRTAPRPRALHEPLDFLARLTARSRWAWNYRLAKGIGVRA
jgi:hypothetical protein